MKKVKNAMGAPKKTAPTMVKISTFFPKKMLDELDSKAISLGVCRAYLLRKFCKDGLKNCQDDENIDI